MKINHGVEKAQILAVEDKCNAIVDNVIEFSVVA